MNAPLAASLLLLAPQESRPAASVPIRVEAGPLPAGAAMAIEGEAVSEEAYGLWLARHRGDLFLREFVASRAVRRAAAAEGIAVAAEEVAARVEEEIAERVKHAFLGDREKWARQEVYGLGRTMETFLRERREQAETALLVERMLLRRRRVTEEDVRARFEERYGKGGRLFSFRHVLLETRYPSGPPAPPAEVERRRREVDEQVRARAAAIRAQIAGGMDLAQAARAFSDDEATKEKGGLVGRYTPFLFGPLFEAEVWSLKKGATSDPIRGNRGWHLVEITEEQVTPLESVAAAIRAELEARRPLATEAMTFVAELVSGKKVVR